MIIRLFNLLGYPGNGSWFVQLGLAKLSSHWASGDPLFCLLCISDYLLLTKLNANNSDSCCGGIASFQIFDRKLIKHITLWIPSPSTKACPEGRWQNLQPQGIGATAPGGVTKPSPGRGAGDACHHHYHYHHMSSCDILLVLFANFKKGRRYKQSEKWWKGGTDTDSEVYKWNLDI